MNDFDVVVDVIYVLSTIIFAWQSVVHLVLVFVPPLPQAVGT